MASTKVFTASMEILGKIGGSKGTPTRSTKVFLTDNTKHLVGEIHDYNTPGAVTTSPGGVQNI